MVVKHISLLVALVVLDLVDSIQLPRPVLIQGYTAQVSLLDHMDHLDHPDHLDVKIPG